ncbi:MAG: hypothetical protein JW918_08815 [Anaerolineae bacterium]|nr:hypothetical protein [Anaerolineae bacterium]
MNKRRSDDILAAHAEGLLSRTRPMQQINAGDEERGELAPLFALAEQLYQSMPPVQPSAAFVHSLGKELAGSAKHQIATARRMRRGVLIGAATVGSLVSIASLVGAVVYIVSRLRARLHAHAH